MSVPALVEHPSEKALRRMFALAILQSRTDCALSQERLAELSGLSTSYISLLERGQRNLTMFSAARIAAACELKLSELVLIAEVAGGGGS